MREIAEILVAERVVTHVLDQRAAVGKGMRFLEILCARSWESFGKQRLNVVLPKKVDDLFMGEHRISAANLGQAEEQPDTKHGPPTMEESSDARAQPVE